MINNYFNNYIPKVPAPYAQFLLRIPISIMFLQQGISKLPVNEATAEMYGLPYIVWWFVTYGEIGAAIGLLFGGILGFKDYLGIGDLITRFSGITMSCIMTGVIWISAPADLISVLMYDYLHVSLYFVGLYFALRGNAKWDS